MKKEKLRHFKNTLILMVFLLTSIVSSQAQQRIRGKITNADSAKPLAGVSIYQKNDKSQGYIFTDRDGNFELFITQPTDIINLGISLIGFTPLDTVINIQELSTNKRLILKLKEESTTIENIDVLVSTGYQALSKERSTGSYTYIDNNKFNQQISTDVLSRLEATANGLMFDRGTSSSPRISIRGLSTLQSNMTEPLIVLDNFPYDGDLDNINPNDVESITILKDAAAASIWGAKAANGVIVITTKKGKQNQPLQVDFSANSSIVNKPNLFYTRAISSSDFIDVEHMLYTNGFYNNDINSNSRPALSPVVELLIKRETASAAEIAQIDSEINALRNHDVRNDFDKYIYQRGIKQQYNLNLRGGSQIMGWSLAAGYDNNTDNLDAGYKRVNLRFQNQISPIKNLNITSGLTFTQSKSASGRQGIGEVTARSGGLYPYARFANEDGKPLAIVKDWRYPYIETFGDGRLLDWRYYPLEDYKSIEGTNDLADLLANIGVNYRLPNGFNIDLKYQYERQNTENRNNQGVDSYFARNYINGRAEIDGTGNIIFRVPPGGIVDYTDTKLSAHNLRGQLNYDKIFGKHSITAILGGEIRETMPISHSSRTYGFDENTYTSGRVDYTVQYPHSITGARTFIEDRTFASHKNIRFASFYANAAYTYNKRYTVSASARRDASNLFGFKTNDRWNPLWSAGFSWSVSEEGFYGQTLMKDYLPYLKFRLSYGYSGNIHPSLASATTIQYYGNSPYTMLPYARFDNYANPKLKWETTGMFNAGLDFRSKNNRIQGSIEYYRKRSTDLFSAVPIDYTSGIGTMAVKNVASMKGYGWDISLNSININKGFKWETEVNFSTNKDEVIDYYRYSERASTVFTSVTPSISGIKGKPVYPMLSYKWAGLDPTNGMARGYLDGEISSDYRNLTGENTTVDDLVYHGSAIPTMFGSIGNTFTWKGFSASVRIMYKFDYYFRKATISYNSLYRNWQGHSDYSSRWQSPGDELITDIPAVIYPASTQAENFYRYTEPFVLKGDHIRLQYINFSYRLDQASWKQLPFSSLQLFVNASNLGILWKANKEGLDPDYGYSTNMLIPPNTYSLGIRINM
ncbi:SusC/RagA family TonB-linked outer membrane protein [Sphingobacterium phlebotomi]|uniref:SusC/RagA family TonB-linked outer membrane protein n=1 Tax=Sphingobacterium phlebotomi TaxID=2605433 RepID=A0A5D4H8H6_9SPHI|nr:SusC/RagA family TonB-linked outer membrane protein [Sphingobacterium phlebotomi]TYR37441.1 SusC/RagA family TonB-linked outer membrane protein [Sphingobacterium phlebotomi]